MNNDFKIVKLAPFIIVVLILLNVGIISAQNEIPGLKVDPAGNVGVGTLDPSASAKLHVYSESKGILIPRIEWVNKGNITPLVEGLIVYFTSDNPDISGPYYYDTARDPMDWVKMDATVVNWDDIDNLPSEIDDDQNLTEADLVGTMLTINIENGDPVTVDLGALAGLIGSDDQNLTEADLVGTMLTIEIENGDPVTVDLGALAGLIGSDDQNLTFSIVGSVLTIGIENGDPVEINLADLSNNLNVWNLNGNNTDSGSFLGTNNEQPLRIGTFGEERILVTETGDVGVGTTSPSQKLDVNGNILGHGFGMGGEVDRVLAPEGAVYRGIGLPETGAIKVTLPVSWTNTMMKFVVKVFDYQTNESFNIHVAGYNHTSGKWFNPSAWIESSAQTDRNFTVRFGHDGTKCCILIGEIDSQWGYPKFSVVDFQGSTAYNSIIDDWVEGWDISLETVLPSNIDRTITNTQINNWSRNGDDVYWSSGNGNVGIGTSQPTQKLDLDGDIRVRGLSDAIVYADDEGVLREASINGATFSNGEISIIDNVDDADNDPTNEIQEIEVFSLDGTNLNLALDNNTQVTQTVNLSSLQDGNGYWNKNSSNELYYNDTNVGIGVSNPQAQLHVDGQTVITNSSSGAASMFIGKGGNSTQAAELNFVENSSANFEYGYRFRLDGSLNRFFLESKSNSDPIVQMSFDRDSRGVGIGDVVATEELDIDGDIRVRGLSNAIVYADDTGVLKEATLDGATFTNGTLTIDDESSYTLTNSPTARYVEFKKDGSTISSIDRFWSEKADGYKITNGIGVGTDPIDGLGLTTVENIKVGNVDIGFKSNSLLFGQEAMLNNTLNNSVAIGTSALSNAPAGADFNVAVGTQALQDASDESNVGIGYKAGKASGRRNVSIGHLANETGNGDENVAIGYLAGRNNTGSSNIFIGSRQDETGSVSNILKIDVVATDNPLIEGDFELDEIKINGDLKINGKMDSEYPSNSGIRNVAWGDNVITAQTTGGNAFVFGQDNGYTANNVLNSFISGSTNLGLSSSIRYSFVNGWKNNQNNTGFSYYNFLLGAENAEDAQNLQFSFISGFSNAKEATGSNYSMFQGSENFKNVSTNMDYIFAHGRQNYINATDADHSFVSGFRNGYNGTSSNLDHSTIIGTQNHYEASATSSVSTMIGYRNMFSTEGIVSNTISIGNANGYEETGSLNNCVYLGYRQAYTNTNEASAPFRLAIGMYQDNALIYGEFDNEKVKVNGDFESTGKIKVGNRSGAAIKGAAYDIDGNLVETDIIDNNNLLTNGAGYITAADVPEIDIQGGLGISVTGGNGEPYTIAGELSQPNLVQDTDNNGDAIFSFLNQYNLWNSTFKEGNGIDLEIDGPFLKISSNEVDGSISNELQNLTYDGNTTIGITMGNTIDLSPLRDDPNAWKLNGNGSTSWFSPKLGFTVVNDKPLTIYTNNQERMRIAEDGKVGINTIGPESDLHIEGNIVMNLSTPSNDGYYGTNSLGPNAGVGGHGNNFMGKNAGQNSTGEDNNYFGTNAGGLSESGSKNNFFGFSAGVKSFTGNDNNFFGAFAGAANGNGNGNNYIGYSAGKNADGNHNNYFGFEAGSGSITGNENNYIGYQTGLNSEGSGNTFVGYQAGYYNKGDDNIIIGTNTNNGVCEAIGTTGNDNICIGSGVKITTCNLTNSIGIGTGVVLDASDQIFLGSYTVNGAGTPINWTTASDQRFKENISETVSGLDFIKLLRPVQYNMDMDAYATFLNVPAERRDTTAENVKAAIKYTGFLAQEVEQAANSLGFDFSGVDTPNTPSGYYGLRYSEFVVPLVKAVQEQQVIIDDQKTQIEDLEIEMDSQKATINLLLSEIQSLKTRVQALEN